MVIACGISPVMNCVLLLSSLACGSIIWHRSTRLGLIAYYGVSVGLPIAAAMFNGSHLVG